MMLSQIPAYKVYGPPLASLEELASFTPEEDPTGYTPNSTRKNDTYSARYIALLFLHFIPYFSTNDRKKIR